MEAAVVANSREITRDVVSMTRLSGSGKTSNDHHHSHPHHQHPPHLQKPRVPPKHAGLTKNGLSQDPLVLKASSKESMKETSVALTRLLCGEDRERRETRGGGETAGNKSQQQHHHYHHHPLQDEATVGGSFSETVSRSPIWGHQTSKVRDSSVTRSRSFSCGNKANVSPVRHNRKEDGDRKKEGAENETTTNKAKVTQKAETALGEKHQQHQTSNKVPVKSISVRQQWMAKRRSLSNSPKIGVASEPKEHRKSQAVLSELVPVEAACAEVLPLTSGMRVGRKKLSVRRDETEHRHRHAENPYTDDGNDGSQAPENKGCVSSATADSMCAGSKDTSQEKAFAESDDCEQVTIISGNLKGSQKGKVVYVDRKHMQSSFSSSLGETAGAGTSAGSADSSVPLMRDALLSGTQSSNSSSSAHTSDCATVCKDTTTLVKPVDDVRKHTDTSASKQSMVPLEENSSSNKTSAPASKRNNTAINISQEDAHCVSVICNPKKVSDNNVVPSQKVVCDTEAGHSAVTVKDDIVKNNVCDSEIGKAKIVVCEKQKQNSSTGSLRLSSESRQNSEPAVVLTDSGIKVLADRVVVKSPTAAPRTKIRNIVAEVHISDGKVSTDVDNVNSIEMKTFRESSKDNKSSTVSVTATPNRISDKAEAKTSVASATVVFSTTSTTTVTVSNASTKTHTATTVSVTSTITSTSTTNSSSCQAILKPASSNSSSSGSEREKVYANEDSLPNSPQNVPEEGTTPTDNIEITDLDFFKTDIVRSSHCKRNGFSSLLGPSNSPKQVREVAVATTPMRDLAELTGLARPPPPPAGRGGARNACVTIVEVHHQPPAKKHTVDIVPASNARSLDGASVSSALTNTFPTTTTITNSCNDTKSSSIHLASPRAHARPMRETSSSSSSRDSSPEKKGDLAVALTSSQDEKNRVRDLMAAALQQEEAGKAKAKVKEVTAASDAPDRKNASKDLAAAVTSSQDEKNRTMAAVAACSSSSSTSASTSCSSSQSEKKSRGEPILKPKARTKPAKSVSFNNKDVIATETPDNGFHFQLGILKECEVQVQAFLEDADSVLEALDQCQAEEKCLMLIKRPRESAKKMLKSQSWANLSVSDPQLYRQFNGLQVAQVHQPIAQPASLKDKRALIEPPMASREEEEGELPEQHARRRYVSNRDRVSAKPQHQRLSLPADGPLLHGVAGDYSFGSDSPSSSSCSTVSSDCQYNAPRRERRLELRYPSIPEDEVQEINNNKGFGAVAGDLESSRPLPPSTSSSSAAFMYHSCHDVSFASQVSSGVRSERSYPQGHGDQAHGRQYLQQAPQRFGVAGKDSGSLVNPTPQQAAYRHYQQQQQQQSKGHAHDPGDLDEESRSQSLGNLSTGGLTLSLVGQRKADSMVDLASPTSPPPPATATQLRPHRPAPRSHRSESYQQDFFPSQHASQHGQATVGSPRHSYPEPHNVRTPRVREDLQAYASLPSSGGGGQYGPGGAVQQSPSRHQARPQPQHAARNYPSYAGGMPRSHHQHQHQHQQQLPAQHQAAPGLRNGYGEVRGETGFPNGAPPPKPKRNLPHVSLNETSEKIKRFTEMMKSRMSVSSTSSRSSATPQTPTTPLSRQPSVTTDNGSDCEVSNLLDSGPGAGDGRVSGLPHRSFNPASASQDGKALGEQTVARGHVGLPLTHPPSMMGPHCPHPQQPCSSASYSSSALSEVGGPASFTSHSHSSTLDSGYTTNNECEADSCLSGYPHHPHHKMLSPPHLHQPPKVLPSRPPQQQVHLQHLQHHNPPHQAQKQQYPVHPYQPQGQPAEPLRPVPQPRNLSLANACKYSSMQNVHSRPVMAQDPLHPDFHNGENGGQAGPGHLSRAYDSNADHGHHSAVLEHQRRSWDLAQSFKSLEFVPASSGPASMDPKSAAAMVAAVKGREDTAVVKPLPVSGSSSSSGNNSSSSGGSHACSSAGSSPAHRPDAQRRDTQPRTQRRSSWQEMVRAQEGGEGGGRGSESPPPPLPALPPPALDASGVSSLPGHWKSNNNTSSNNNRRPNAVILQAGSSSNSGSNSGASSSGASSSGPSTPQRTPLRLASIDTGSGSAVGCTSPTPSLFQLSQLYDMRSLRFRNLQPSSTLAQVLTLTAAPVSLPAGGLDAAASPPAHSPQGRTAKLGGPGSAFRKVASTGAGAGGQGVVLELTAVAAVLDPSPELWTLGPPLVGDLIVEINGRQCIGWEVARIQESLSATQGDILMGVARKREQQTDGRVQQLEISLKTLEQEVQKMKEELAKKDARILELSTMLPWKREEEDSKDGKLLLEPEEGAFVIGENEFVV